MLAPLPCVEAFRRDAVSIEGVDLDDGVAASWLESATRLERAAMTRGAERERLLAGLLAQHNVVPFRASPIPVPALFSTVMGIGQDMLDSACFRTAHSILSTLLVLLPESETLLRGRVIAVQGRLARELGDGVSSRGYYEEVEQLAISSGLQELTGRAWVGLGILARHRGDYPEARRLCSAVIELKGAASDSVANAHHELLIMCAGAADYDCAAKHGWAAFRGASNTTQETEALINLAQLLLDAGHSRAALRGFAAALARTPVLRLELGILGGAACAAAAALPQAAARAVVRNFSERLEHLLRSRLREGAMPHAAALSLVELSEALTVVGDEERATRMAAQASTLASAHGFHQLSYRLENPVVVAAPAPLAPATHEIIAAVDELEGAELVAAG